MKPILLALLAMVTLVPSSLAGDDEIAILNQMVDYLQNDWYENGYGTLSKDDAWVMVLYMLDNGLMKRDFPTAGQLPKDRSLSQDEGCDCGDSDESADSFESEDVEGMARKRQMLKNLLRRRGASGDGTGDGQKGKCPCKNEPKPESPKVAGEPQSKRRMALTQAIMRAMHKQK